MTPIRDVDELLAVLAGGDGVGDGEDVDLLAHSLQCAALLAEAAPHDPELQVAGLVHDVGTLVLPGEPGMHAAIGAAAIGRLLGNRVGALVAQHDVAKRYLVTVDPSYRARLSERSIATLRVQGGLLDPEERATFELAPCFDDVVVLRQADDAAKDPGRTVPSLSAWRDAVESVASAVRV